MKSVQKIWAVTVGLLLGTVTVFAQIETGGGDPGKTRWNELQGGTYRIIYPAGTDSLATVYYNELQRLTPSLARSIGFTPGALQFGKMPVILHPFTPYCNGSVVWAPRRMDLYTMPEPYGSLPMPWTTQLAVHEGRHLAQMQFGYKGILKYPWYGLGEMWIGALSGLYPGPALLEGDAVVAETALTRSGRGRNADFLNYYHVAFDTGDWRDWYQWRYGSYRHYTPDFYTAGYMIVAGTRYFFNDPLFTREYFKRVNETPWKLFSFQKTVRNASGRKFHESWQKIMQEWRNIWQEEADARAPFDSLEQVTPTPEFAIDYHTECFADGTLYATRDGLDIARQLIALEPDGDVNVLCAFAGTTSSLYFDPERHRIYWSENVRDARWELSGASVIRYFSTKDHKPHNLTSEGRLFNPCPSPDGIYLSCVEYPTEGGSRIRIIRTEDGSTAWTIPAPAPDEQLTETAWTEGILYALSVSEKGYTLWKHDADGSGSWKSLTEPSLSSMSNLGTEEDTVEFVCDASGVNELYSFHPESGDIFRLTASRYGSNDFVRDEEGRVLYCTSQTPEGKMVFRTPVKDLTPDKVDIAKVHAYKVADALSRQEDSLAVFYPEMETPLPGTPKPYGKLSHLIKFHSWAPIYFNYDSISSMSLDFSYQTASLGVTGLFQNELGTAYGFIGYSAHKNPQNRKRWKNSLHGQFTYTGWYPVIEASFDFNDRNAALYRYNKVVDNSFAALSTAAPNPQEGEAAFSRSVRKAPYFEGDISVYVPFSFSRGGWLSGFVPKIRYSISNDIFSTTRRDLSVYPSLPSGTIPVFKDAERGRRIPMQKMILSARGYYMRPVASSNVYPSLGAGAELGYAFRPGVAKIFTPDLYAYLYGYAPGFWHTQGFRFSATLQQMIHPEGRVGDNHLLTLPRGIDPSLSPLLSNAPTQARLTVDYAVPIYIGDISVMSPVLYIKNLLIVPHTDFTFAKGFLFSSGADFTVQLANFLWFPFDGSIGFSLNVNGGTRWQEFKDAAKASGSKLHRVSAGFIFSMDI